MSVTLSGLKPKVGAGAINTPGTRTIAGFTRVSMNQFKLSDIEVTLYQKNNSQKVAITSYLPLK
jgi:hypothetical protein